ncbi:hypothetical protein Pmani_030920 [Petrolisthes manimaculis]|uniref:Uncharacterized protein n=1 Tax=Petrolisthes manimaculis TaxID=1843537 RepID=A0AAE1TVE7_9EUCA|nr:hypothetical protein Pmani_030920 [Petrolisthes manimaculis]
MKTNCWSGRKYFGARIDLWTGNDLVVKGKWGPGTDELGATEMRCGPRMSHKSEKWSMDPKKELHCTNCVDQYKYLVPQEEEP